ncbi:MAG: hydrogenase iron-sulfur subunit [Nitrososphaerota archaeon]|nr:hydrogenase iron-sulfur subunit [Nitrososphaerota archaeon]
MLEETNTILVIGGGIAGIQAALDAAHAGAKVCLVEKAPTIGGKMSALDKNFPTLDCSICIESPKMSDIGLHPNIELLTLSEIQKLEGGPGDFRATISQNPRYVTDACTRCGECVAVCPVVLKSEFDFGMSARKAIHTPSEQSVPGTYVIDSENCLNEPPNLLPCNRCMDACGPDAINFNMTPKIIQRNIAAVVVATGFDLLDPVLLPEFGYGKHPDVLTSMELERLLQASGPSMGEVVKPSDGKHPKKVLFILCAGSRDQRYCNYCSRICCMYSIKEAYQLKDHGTEFVDVAYMDIRAYGKGFDEFYDRTKSSGVRFIRSKPARVAPNGNNLNVFFEDTESVSSFRRLESYDMVVLATAILPSKNTPELSKVLGVELAYDGFFETCDESGDYVSSTRHGVYLAGCSTGPKDIPDSVLEAGAAVSKALIHIKHRKWPESSPVIQIESGGEPRVGVFACHCGSNIAGTVNIPELVSFAKTLPGVVHAQDQKYSCAANTLSDISGVLKEKKINRVVVAACSPKTHYSTFQGSLNRAGVNPYLLEMANVRNMDSWVHKEDKEGALKKAKDMVRMAVFKALNMNALEPLKFPVTQKAVVIGGGVAGIVAATNLASQRFETHLVERTERLGGVLNDLREIAPLGIKSKDLLSLLIKELKESGAVIHLSKKIESVGGFVGNYEIQLSDGELLKVGAVVLATGAQPYHPTEFGCRDNPNVLTSLELEGIADNIESKNVAIVSCVGSRNERIGCSRFCCQTMIDQAAKLKERGNNVTILYKDLRAFTRFGEEEYENACRRGVNFIQYPQDSVPEHAIKLDNNKLILKDELLGEEIAIPADLVVLNVGLYPVKEENGVTQQLKVSTDQAGFALESHPKLGPAESMVQGVFLAGTSQYPKSVKESAIQALAAAAKASSIISKDEIEREPFVAVFDPSKCSKCAHCIPVCPYNAIRGEVGKSVEFITAMCQGCGTCVAECAIESALTQEGFTDKQVKAQIDAALEEDASKKVLIFACNWCSYAGADLAGIMKIQYPSNTRIIRTMCSGRVSQRLVLHGFAKGAGAILVTGCHPGDCHYISGNQQTLKRVENWKHLLKMRGVNPDRLQLWWVSAGEGKRFADKAKEMSELLNRLVTAQQEPAAPKISTNSDVASSGRGVRDK